MTNLRASIALSSFSFATAVLCTLQFGTLQVGAAEPEPDIPGDAIIRRYLRQETEKITQSFLAGVESAADWERGREKLHRQYLEMLGLWPLPPRTPLEARTTGNVERDAFRVEKVAFQSRPGLYVTANLYLPKRVEGKLPAVLYLCGHSGRGRDGNKTAFQHHGVWFATHGYVCLIVDTLQLGEVAGIHHGTYSHNRWWWHARGYTPAGVECWNGIRALDYLESRPEVDAARIAATGISGGGAATFWIAAADPRVKVAVPVSGMSDLETFVADEIIDGHCDCMMFVNTHRWELSMIAALVAPRPLLFANSDMDTIFPMPGNERIAARLARLYAILGRPEALGTVVVPGGHSDSLSIRLPAYRWINRWLKGDSSEVSEPEQPKIDGKELRVFPDELPAGAINDRIDETFVPVAHVELPKGQEEYRSWREMLLGSLRERSFAAREADILAPGVQLPQAPRNGRTLWILVPSLGDTETEWVNGHIANARFHTFHPRGVGDGAWKVRPPHTFERALALVGRTADSGRVWDLVLLARKIRAEVKGDFLIGLAGRWTAGVICAYAALLEPAIEEIVVVDPPRSHREGPYFLSVLQVCDIPDALGMLAPRKLTLAGANDETAKRVEAIYEAAGAKDCLKIKK